MNKLKQDGMTARRGSEIGRIPIPLILGIVLLIGGAVTAFLAFSGVITIPGITPEDEETSIAQPVEISAEQNLENRLRQLMNERAAKDNKISQLEERVELKDDRIESLNAEIARLEDLIKLSDETAVRDVAAVVWTPQILAAEKTRRRA